MGENVNKIIIADALDGLATLNNNTINMCVTSPPYYGLRDYGINGQLGLEATPEEYIDRLVEIFREVKRVLRDDGTLWINIGDSYAGSGKGRYADGSHSEGAKQNTNKGSVSGKLKKTEAVNCKNKDLIGIPWLLAFALRADGWYLRNDIIWHKPNAMPESVTDRCTKAHEHIFLLSKSEKYFFNSNAIKEPAGIKGNAKSFRGGGAYINNRAFNNSGIYTRETHGNTKNKSGLRNKRDVWTVPTGQYKEAHFAVFPIKLITPCILAGTRKGDIVLDPFLGSGTTAIAAIQAERNFIGIELKPEYADIAWRRIDETIVQCSRHVFGRGAAALKSCNKE